MTVTFPYLGFYEWDGTTWNLITGRGPAPITPIQSGATFDVDVFDDATFGEAQ